MSVTIIGPTTQPYPSRAIPAVVELKRRWADPWTLVPELEFSGGNVATAAHGGGSCTLVHRYGVLRHPWETTAGRRSPARLDGCWCRVMLAGRQGMQQAWIGRIAGEVREVHGPAQASVGAVPAGVQYFEALGPADVLRRIHVSRSHWLIGSRRELLDWAPSLNDKFGRADKPSATRGKTLGSGPGAKNLESRSGNRSATAVAVHPDHPDDKVFVFGGMELWNYFDFAQYILKMFVDETYVGDGTGPRWTLGGQADVLKNFTDPIRFGVTQDVDYILRSLIRPDNGVDYRIVAGANGFEIQVFVLTRESCGWGEYKLPGNKNTVTVRAGRTQDCIKTSVERSAAARYGTIRLLGDRVVVCASLTTVFTPASASTLEKRWNKQDESEYTYLTGLAGDNPELCDEARRAERFRDVYRKFAATNDWYWSNTIWRSPRWDGRGNPLPTNGAMQRIARSTLNWLPLETGVDYAQKPCVDNNIAGNTPSLRMPAVWLYTSTGGGRWVPADQTGIGVSVLNDDIGVYLHAAPNHLLAAGSYPWTQYYGAKPTNVVPQWDCNKMIATLAYRTDQRIYCEQAISGASPSDGVLEIDATDCQFWWLAPNTMLDVDLYGRPITSPAVGVHETDGTIVRNDWARLAARMAGVLARYYQQRARAQIVLRGLHPWGELLGRILTVIDEGGETQTIEAPITSVRWSGGENPTTTISTGFARE